MELKDRIVVVTGAASGIGAGLARKFKEEGARAVVCADLNLAGAEAVADAKTRLARSFTPMTDQRGSADYRAAMVTRLLDKLWAETGASA